MIVQMKKVSLVVLDREREESCKKLRKMGLVHLQALEGKGEKFNAFKESFSETSKAISILSEIKSKKKEAVKQEKLSYDDAKQMAKEIVSLTEKKKSLFDSINQDTQELSRFTDWGSVSIDDFTFIASKNIYLYMYEIPQDKYSLIGEDCKTILVNNTGKIARFLLLSESEVLDRPKGIPAEAYSVPLPRDSTNKILSDIRNAKINITKIDNKLYESKKYLSTLKDYKKLLEKDIEFEGVYSGMEHEEGEGESEKLAWVTGFVPVDSMKNFEEACKANEWAYVYSDPEEDDEVPTKLKNNKLVSLIYPLTDFLGTVPGYREYDISGWFLLFFVVFFGMIFGDGGYGLLVTVAGLILILKSLFKGKAPSALVGLLTLLGLSTVGWGFVTCTWFGLTPEQLEKFGLGFLTKITVPVLSNAYATAADGTKTLWSVPWMESGKGLTTDQNMQIFCFSLALLQLSIAHLKGIGRYIKSLKALGELGSLLQLWGMFYIVLMLVVSGEVFALDAIMVGGVVPIGFIFAALIGIGFVLSFIFSNYEGSVKESVMTSVKGIISVLLGVVNVFSDIVSYIRLWAVGLAGAAISNTVNSMAGPLLGHAILFLAAVLLLCFGHGLNMILNVLSVVVHGVRLNTLEFSTHLGMSWSGFKYEPFREK